ncbi:MAG: isocitrate/isopropylmalate dehydrogenase family protein [Clostridia bacterium]|nr:isocitrate/isopropylmalate dehydrogenase family protein [Clostridia bacterium]MBQ1934593.1 isocitrate/isopropylmalate dehydrogenase family protein [Clostridia bacterium]
MNNNYEAEIKACLEKYETILREQIARAERMEQDAGAVDFTKKEKIIIGLIGGDGIGPIIMESAKKVLELLLKDKIADGKVELRVIEGLTLENRLAKGQSVPDDVLAAIKACDVILKGPTTTPKGGTDAPDMESANVTLRRELDLYANVRPVSVPEKGIDWTFFRENTEGEYVLGSRGVEIKDKLACDFKVTTDAGTKRITRAAFEFAKNNGKDNVAIVTKANIMKKTDGKFSRIANQIAAEYPEIQSEEWYIDIMAANLVNENIRTKFKVFLLPNLYGDIITDEAAQIQGGVGTGGSSNVGDKYAMFEAIHGSAPRMIAEGIGHYANPQSVIKAAEMLLRHVCLVKEADILAAALEKTTAKDAKVKIDECKGATCAEYTEYLLEELGKNI